MLVIASCIFAFVNRSPGQLLRSGTVAANIPAYQQERWDAAPNSRKQLCIEAKTTKDVSKGSTPQVRQDVLRHWLESNRARFDDCKASELVRASEIQSARVVKSPAQQDKQLTMSGIPATLQTLVEHRRQLQDEIQPVLQSAGDASPGTRQDTLRRWIEANTNKLTEIRRLASVAAAENAIVARQRIAPANVLPQEGMEQPVKTLQAQRGELIGELRDILGNTIAADPATRQAISREWSEQNREKLDGLKMLGKAVEPNTNALPPNEHN